MFKINLFSNNQELKVLCFGAHPDDIEIGCGGTILKIVEEVRKAQFYYVVFSGNQLRAQEAVNSAKELFKNAKSVVEIKSFRESYFPFIGDKIKDDFEGIKEQFAPDIIFTHYGNDAHQDHRLISSLTWNTFRDNFIVEYEIPKFDGDLANPNFFVNLSESQVERKIKLVMESFRSQESKRWFDEDVFRSLLRIRGVESNSPTKYAEAFHCKKLIV